MLRITKQKTDRQRKETVNICGHTRRKKNNKQKKPATSSFTARLILKRYYPEPVEPYLRGG